MGKHPNLDFLDDLFEKGVDFQLTDKFYQEKSGVPLPKGKNYLLRDSALARRAKERGYLIEDVREKPIIEKTVIFKKKEK